MTDTRDNSVALSSEGDTIEEPHVSLPDVEETTSVQDVPSRTATPVSVKGSKKPRSSVKRSRTKKAAPSHLSQGMIDTEDDSTPVRVKKSGSVDQDVIKTTGTAVGTRRQANGTVGSVYSGSKIRHLKKKDGVPLLRRDIQYSFLHQVVHDETACFTRLSDHKKDCTFSEIYIDSMIRSSKTSKVLKDRLAVDQPAAQNMAMICLLVNVGRMNTTLNFFPEMRAQLRTYHPIPSLQAHPSQKDYKNLQDAPRLKSILKGASEDEDQPRTLQALRQATIPRCNPVNLIFVLAQAANEVSQMHFIDNIDFFDLAMRETISSDTRARAFLWLMWFYLESDFSKEAALKNPFGPGGYREEEDSSDSEVVPLLVPELKHISADDAADENKDPELEIEFGEKMQKERARLNAKFAEEEAAAEANGKEIEHKGVKRLKRTARDLIDDNDSSDVDSRASPVPVRSPAYANSPSLMMADSLEDEMEPHEPHPGKGRYKRVRNNKSTPSRNKGRASEIPNTTSRLGGRSRLGIASDRDTPDTGRGTPQPPPNIHHPIFSQYPRKFESYESSQLAGLSKSRARTGYQRELEEHKQRRVDWLINKKRAAAMKEQRIKRERLEPGWLARQMYRIATLDTTYDSEEDETASIGLSLIRDVACPTRAHNGTGIGGLLPSLLANTDRVLSAQKVASQDAGLEDELGEEAEHWKKIVNRSSRRLFRWSGDKDVEDLRLQKHRQAYGGENPPAGRPFSSGGMILMSSITAEAPRFMKKDLNAEITADLLRSADEGDEDGDTAMED